MKQFFEERMKDGRVLLNGNDKVVVFKQADDLDVLNFYFKKNGKRFFFKANSKYTLDVSELLSYALDKQAGVDAVQFLPAVFEKDGKRFYGVVSEDINQNKTDELVNGSQLLRIFEDDTFNETGKRKERYNTIEHYKQALSLYVGEKDGRKTYLEQDFFTNLAKVLISGFIRADADIHSHNIPFIIKNNDANTRVISVGRLFDKSMSFLLKSHRASLREGFEILSSKEKMAMVEKHLEDTGFPFQVKSSSRRQTGRQFISREIASIILKYPELEKHFNAYKNINIKETLTSFKNQNGYNFIKESDIELADLVVKNSLKLLQQAMEFEKLQNSGPMKFLKQEKEVSLEF